MRGIKPANDSHLLGVEQQQATDWNYVISQFHCSRISTAATSTYHCISTLHSLRVVIIAADKFYYPPNHSQSWFLNAHKKALCSVHVNSYVVIAASPKPELGNGVCSAYFSIWLHFNGFIVVSNYQESEKHKCRTT